MTSVAHQVSRLFVIGGMLLVMTLTASGCAFEVCCMRPATGLYDICIAAAVPVGAGYEKPIRRQPQEIAPPAHQPSSSIAR